MQSDQSLYLSLEYSMSAKLLTEHYLVLISSKVGCIGSSESTLVKMPHCWKSHALAHYDNCSPRFTTSAIPGGDAIPGGETIPGGNAIPGGNTPYPSDPANDAIKLPNNNNAVVEDMFGLNCF